MIYNPGKLQSAADTLSRCRPLHMLYVSLDQVKNADQDDELKEFLELNYNFIGAGAGAFHL